MRDLSTCLLTVHTAATEEQKFQSFGKATAVSPFLTDKAPTERNIISLGTHKWDSQIWLNHAQLIGKLKPSTLTR